MIKLNGIKTENREPTLGKKGKYISFFFTQKNDDAKRIFHCRKDVLLYLYKL